MRDGAWFKFVATTIGGFMDNDDGLDDGFDVFRVQGLQNAGRCRLFFRFPTTDER